VLLHRRLNYSGSIRTWKFFFEIIICGFNKKIYEKSGLGNSWKPIANLSIQWSFEPFNLKYLKTFSYKIIQQQSAKLSAQQQSQVIQKIFSYCAFVTPIHFPVKYQSQQNLSEISKYKANPIHLLFFTFFCEKRIKEMNSKVWKSL
jgi:hypothetical protein